MDCQPLEPLEADDDYDGIDDDCDGSVDEHYVIPETTCGTGICARTGKLFCISGTQVDSCQPLEPASGDTDCNGQDDDCDGLIDEDFIAEVTSLRDWSLRGRGPDHMQPGGVQGDTCVPGSPAVDDATCDGVDDDCDGKMDEDYGFTVVECGEEPVFPLEMLLLGRGDSQLL